MVREFGVAAALMALAVVTVSADAGRKLDARWSGSVRVRAESFSDYDFNSTRADRNSFVVERLRLKGDLPLDNETRFQLVLQDAKLFGEEFPVLGGERNVDFHEAFVEKKALLGNRGLSLKVGRQELAYGDERLVGVFGWNNVGRTYDAVRLRLERKKAWHELFVSRIIHDASAPADQSLWGLYNGFDLGGKRVLEAYLFRRLDPRATVRLDEYTYGVRSKGPLAGDFDYSVEAALQAGERAGLDIDAWAWHSGLGYSLKDRRKTRLSVEVNAASGDDDPTAGDIKTFDNLFPTNHFLYGMGDFFSWRNMSEFKLALSTDVNRKLRATLDWHLFALQDVRDFWYRAARTPLPASLRDPTGLASDDAGSEWDLLLKYQWRKDVGLEAGYARFTPGDNQQGRGRPSDDANWAYLQTTYTF